MRRFNILLSRVAAVAWLPLALTGCSGGRDTTHPATNESAHGLIAPTANVPALVGQPIDGLRRQLRPVPLPAGFTDPLAAEARPPAAYDSVMSFRTGGLLLVASYNARTRQVRDLLLVGSHEDSLMGRAALRSNAQDYLLLPVFAGREGQFIGLRVVPTPTGMPN